MKALSRYPCQLFHVESGMALVTRPQPMIETPTIVPTEIQSTDPYRPRESKRATSS